MATRKPQHIFRRGRRVELVPLSTRNAAGDVVVGAYSPLWAELRGLGVTEYSEGYAVTHLASGFSIKRGFARSDGARAFMYRIADKLDWRKPAETVLATPHLEEIVENAYASLPDYYKPKPKE
jgi:hypothetical protein